MSYKVSKLRKQKTNTTHQNSKQKSDWYRLDNAASVFSFVTSSRIPCMFRLSISLKKPINVTILQQALEQIIDRFPYYKVELRQGLFWYYWEENPNVPKVMKERRYPCGKLPLKKRGIFPFRVKAFYNRIAVEFHHSITDGTGAITFLKTLVAEYFKILGLETSEWKDTLKINETPHQEEYEDAFKKNYQKSVPAMKKISRAFHLPSVLEPKGVYHVLTGIMPVKDVIKKSKELNVTLTEYLTAIYLESLQELLFDIPKKKRKRLLKPIRLQVPVNLRRIFPSKTMRNFSLYVTPSIDPRLGKHSFEEILKQVYHYLRIEVCDKFISQQIARNVRGELNPLLRITPLAIKKKFGKLIYNNLGEFLYSGVITNLGKVSFPEEISNEIEELQFIPTPSPTTKSGCAIASFKDELYITFGRNIKETTLERIFFTRLVKDEIKIRIESN